MKLINLFFPFRDFLYILQLEEYDVRRYFKKLFTTLFKRDFEVRDTLKFTVRIKVTFVFSTFCVFVYYYSLFVFGSLIGLLVALVSTPVVTPFFIGFTSYLLSIPATYLKSLRLKKAKQYFKKHYPDTKVIAITGSFGKTTTKYLSHHVLQYDYKTAIIPDNINTGIGIANYILSGAVTKDTEILIVEMAAYTRGDIEQSAKTLKPDIAVLTVLGDQHMERFGSFKKLVLGKAEIFTTHKSKCYTSEKTKGILEKYEIQTTTLVTVPDSDDSKQLVKKLALDLGVSTESIENSFANFKNPSRRNEQYEKDSVLIIDNSYNISPMIATKLLQNAHKVAEEVNKELVVMTGGIGEQAPNNDKVNRVFAEELNTFATRVIINPTNFAKAIIPELTIPYTVASLNSEVIDTISDHVDGEKEILLWLTGQTDLEYV